MNKTEDLQQIKEDIIYNMGWSNDDAVKFIARILARSEKTIYEYLSNGRADIPDHSLELLKMKLREKKPSL